MGTFMSLLPVQARSSRQHVVWVVPQVECRKWGWEGGRPPPPAIAEAAWTRTAHPDRRAASAGHGGGRSRVAPFCFRVCSLLPRLLTVLASWTATSSASCTRRRLRDSRPAPAGAAASRRPGPVAPPLPAATRPAAPHAVAASVSGGSRRASPPAQAVWLRRYLLCFLLATAAVWRPHASWMRMCRRRPWCMACGGYVGSGAHRAWEEGRGKRGRGCASAGQGGLLVAGERACVADGGERGGGGGSGMFLFFVAVGSSCIFTRRAMSCDHAFLTCLWSPCWLVWRIP